MGDGIKTGQLWGVDWPDTDHIHPAVRGKKMGYRIVEVYPYGFAVTETKSGQYGRYRRVDKPMPKFWKLIEDVP